MSKTIENLAQAFAGESQASKKYLAFAKKAEAEGYRGVAKLFRAAAAAETVHALAHLAAMIGIGSTVDNLRAAISGETDEFESMYPPMILGAKAEGNKAALRSFEYANAVEKVHAQLYKDALAALGRGGDVEYYVCKVCGNTVEGHPPDVCPICGSGKQAFEKID
jgi:rubrerythrin